MLNQMKSFTQSALLIIATNPIVALAQSSPQGPYDWRDWGPWHMWGGWGFGWIFPLFMMMLMIAFCVLIASWMFGGHRHGRSHGDHVSSALQILSERFAKGEISKEEFEERRAILVRRP